MDIYIIPAPRSFSHQHQQLGGRGLWFYTAKLDDVTFLRITMGYEPLKPPALTYHISVAVCGRNDEWPDGLGYGEVLRRPLDDETDEVIKYLRPKRTCVETVERLKVPLTKKRSLMSFFGFEPGTVKLLRKPKRKGTTVTYDFSISEPQMMNYLELETYWTAHLPVPVWWQMYIFIPDW